jgi:hypothetical protein
MTLPDAEVLVTTFLRQDPDVTALVGDEVYSTLPAKQATWPVVRVTRVGGSADPLGIIDFPLVQVDVWGGPKTTAQDIAQAMRTAFATRLPLRLGDLGTLALGPGDGALGSLRDLPDETFDPARPRYIFDVRLLTRP